MTEITEITEITEMTEMTEMTDKTHKIFFSHSLHGLIASVLLGMNQASMANMPVIDAGEIAQTVQVVSNLEQEGKTLKAQYTQMQEQYKSITGHYQWGNVGNDAQNLQREREWAPSDWNAALAGMSGGNPDRYKELLDEYKKNHYSLSEADFSKGSSPQMAKAYTSAVQTNQVSGTQATYEFNEMNTHLKNLADLGHQIESAENLKSAIDLNSRIQLEVGFVAAEELRMQTLLNQQLAQSQASQIAAQSQAAQFNQAGDKN